MHTHMLKRRYRKFHTQTLKNSWKSVSQKIKKSKHKSYYESNREDPLTKIQCKWLQNL